MSAGDPTVLGDGARFVVEKRIGQGQFGVVYAARDRQSGRHVAIKLLADLGPAALQAVQQEFALLAQVQHPSVVQVVGIFEDDGDPFLVMERVDGRDVVSWVRSDVRPEAGARRAPGLVFGQSLIEPGASAFAIATEAGIARARTAARALVAGLEAIHARGVVHRDLRPENVRVTPQGRIVIIDFGLAMAQFGGDGGAVDAVVGTPAYMAPEQWDTGATSAASDWYSLGIVLFQALTGALPFSGSAQEVLVKKRTVGAPRVSHLLGDSVPRDLDDAIASLLSVDRARRAAGAAALRSG